MLLVWILIYLLGYSKANDTDTYLEEKFKENDILKRLQRNIQTFQLNYCQAKTRYASQETQQGLKLSTEMAEKDKGVGFLIALQDAEANGGNSFNRRHNEKCTKEDYFDIKLSGVEAKGMKLSDVEAKSMKLSDVEAKSMKLSDVEAKSMKLSDVEAKSMKLSDVEAKSIKLSDVEAKSMKLSDVDAKSMKLSDVKAKSMKLPDVEAKCMKLSDVEAKCMKLSDVEAKSMKLSDVEAKSMKLSDVEAKSMKLSDAERNNENETCNANWIKTVTALRKSITDKTIVFFKKWKETLPIFSKEYLSDLQFTKLFPRMEVDISLKAIRSVDTFQKLFWPFLFKMGFMNQKLALYGLTTVEVPQHEQKTSFYSTIERSLQLGIPFSERDVVYSFEENSNLILNLNKSGLLKNSEAYMNNKRHLFTPDERTDITQKVDVAMKYLQDATPEIHLTINQLVACFAFYKSEERVHVGGTSCSTPGVIWLDPSGLSNATVQFFVEQIVHEYIHNSLCYTEMVHGIFSDHAHLSQAKSVSSIRRELRNYDKSFHAAYVSTGLVAFHARAGSLKRAEELVPGLRIAVDDLVTVNKQTGILTESGEAMLQAMVDFLRVIRLHG